MYEYIKKWRRKNHSMLNRCISSAVFWEKLIVFVIQSSVSWPSLCISISNLRVVLRSVQLVDWLGESCNLTIMDKDKLSNRSYEQDIILDKCYNYHCGNIYSVVPAGRVIYFSKIYREKKVRQKLFYLWIFGF